MVEEALESIERQTALHRIREVIIVDDGSEAETIGILKHQAATRPLVRLILQSNSGLPSARNAGIAAATGDYFAFLDADDWWDDKKFEKQMMLFSASPRVGITYTDFFLVDPANFSNRARVKCRRFHWDDERAQRNYFIHDAPMIPSSIILKRKVVERVGPFDPLLPWGEDNEMCIRTLGSFAAEHMPEPLLLKRQRPNSLGSNYDRIVPYYERVTEKCVRAFPWLAPYAGRRMSRRYTRAGQSSLAKEDRTSARRWFVKGIRSHPGYYRPWVFLVLSMLPVNAFEGMMTFARRLRHA